MNLNISRQSVIITYDRRRLRRYERAGAVGTEIRFFEKG